MENNIRYAQADRYVIHGYRAFCGIGEYMIDNEVVPKRDIDVIDKAKISRENDTLTINFLDTVIIRINIGDNGKLEIGQGNNGESYGGTLTYCRNHNTQYIICAEIVHEEGEAEKIVCSLDHDFIVGNMRDPNVLSFELTLGLI